MGLDLRRVASEMDGVIQTSVEQHCLVAQSIISSDAEGAVEAYKLHLRHIRDTTIAVKLKSGQ